MLVSATGPTAWLFEEKANADGGPATTQLNLPRKHLNALERPTNNYIIGYAFDRHHLVCSRDEC
jgi:hypothetical protein